MKNLLIIALLALSLQAVGQGQFQKETSGSLSYGGSQVAMLAAAIPADKYSWTPETGVRSVAEVLAHIVSANYFFASKLGGKIPEGVKMETLEKDLKTTGTVQLSDWLSQNDATLVTLSTGMFRTLLEKLPHPNEQRFPKLRLLDIGGEWLTDSEIVLWKQHFAPDCILQYGYASTEADWVTQLLMDKASAVSTGFQSLPSL
jgi:hypothetical protein